MHTRKLVLGLRLIKLLTAIKMQILKIHIGHKKIQSRLTKLNEIIEMYCNSYVTEEILEMINNKILFVLEKARKHVEGLQRIVPYLQVKAKA